MTTDVDQAEAVNPLTGELTEVTVTHNASPGGTRQVEGRVVAPGLAITPYQTSSPLAAGEPPRYSVTHLPSGLGLPDQWCGQHVQEIAAEVVESGIDWTADKDTVVTAIKATDGLIDKMTYRCADWCAGDGPRPPIWEVRCNTCDWQSDDDDGEPILTADAARYAGRHHTCEPDIEICHPQTGEWHDMRAITRDGAVRDPR